MRSEQIYYLTEVCDLSTYEALKDAIGIAKKLGQMELLEQLLEVKEQLSELRADNLAKGDQIRTLQQQLELTAKIEFDQGVYWIRKDPVSGGEGDTPICPTCYDVSGLVVRQSLYRGTDTTSFFCTTCKHNYYLRQNP